MRQRLKNLQFSGGTALITGASGGLGRALAWALAEQGMHLGLLARREEELAKLKQELVTSHPTLKVAYVRCDVAHAENVREGVAALRAQLPPISLVIANAGYSAYGTVFELELATYRRQMDVNVMGVLHLVHETLGDIRQTQGQVVIIGSVSSYLTLAGRSAYALSKFALRGFAQGLDIELFPEGAGCSFVTAGYMATDTRRMDNLGEYDPHARETVAPHLLMPPDAAARAIVRGVRRRRPEILLTLHARVLVWCERLMPGFIAWVIKRLDLREKKVRAHR